MTWTVRKAVPGKIIFTRQVTDKVKMQVSEGTGFIVVDQDTDIPWFQIGRNRKNQFASTTCTYNTKKVAQEVADGFNQSGAVQKDYNAMTTKEIITSPM